MFFVGIDIGKRSHEACIIDQLGQQIGKTLRFNNNLAGGHKLLEWLRKTDPTLTSTCIAMEATGHYWLALYSFLRKNGLVVRVINPIQSDSFRNLYIRQTKNDAKDAFIIAEVLCFGRYSATELANEDIVALRRLCRFRFNLVDTIADLKRQAIALLDTIFPEYENVFSDIFGTTSAALLLEYTTPEEIVAVDTDKLADFLAKYSRNRFGHDKAQKLQQAAKTTFGIDFALDAYRFQLRIILEQIRFTEEQLALLEKEIIARLEKLNQNLVTIPGIGPVLAASIIGEIGDISRFATGAKLVAYAGIDPSVYQSGEFTGNHSRMSKRGSPYLRRAIWLAATVAKVHNPILKDFLLSKNCPRKTPVSGNRSRCQKAYVYYSCRTAQ